MAAATAPACIADIDSIARHILWQVDHFQGALMDHHEKRHEQHKKEREHEDKLKKEREHHQENMPRRIHPVWFVAIGCILIALVVLLWTSY
jgi:type VI protein secretion system component VasF